MIALWIPKDAQMTTKIETRPAQCTRCGDGLQLKQIAEWCIAQIAELHAGQHFDDFDSGRDDAYTVILEYLNGLMDGDA